MAQLGDWDAARRLATQASTRDSLQVWRAEQRALRGQTTSAMQSALTIGDAGTRADSLLLVARLAIERGEVEAARAPLLGAMRVLDRAPDAAQLAYAAWLWGQSGDRESARRVLWGKAYPRVLAQKEAQAKKGGKRNRPHDSDEGLVLAFAAQLGFFPDIVAKTKASREPGMGWILLRARNRGDIGLLRGWIENSPAASPDQLLLLAFAAAQLKLEPQARQLRDQARQRLQALPTSQLGLKARALYAEFLVDVQLNDTDALERLQSELQAVSPENAPEVGEFPLIAALVHITVQGDSIESMPRFDVAEAQLDDAAAIILAAKPSRTQLTALEPLAQIEARRHKTERLRQIAEATARSVEQQSRDYAAARRNNGSSSWSGEPFIIARVLRDEAPGTEKVVLDALLRETPLIFRSSSGERLYENGFLLEARQIFDPLAELRRAAALQAAIRRERDPGKQRASSSQQILFNWDEFAAAQARYDAPDAPARWWRALPDDPQRAQVLRAWIGAFYPQVELKAPYVRRVGSSRQYRVGGMAGSSIGSDD